MIKIDTLMIPKYLQNRPFLPLVTDRLILRCFEEKDTRALVHLLKDKQISEMTARIPYPYTLEDAKSWIEKSLGGIQRGKSVNLAIIRRKDQVFLGGIGLEDEIGYWLGVDYWGQGFMTEAVKALLHFAFVTLKLEKIIGSAKEINIASRKIFEHMGFRETGGKPCSSRALEGTLPAITYELTSHEFLSAFYAIKRPVVLVVAAALVNHEGKLLLTSRPPGKKLEGVWELPGGKLEVNETPEHALVRELKEELHIDVAAEDLEPLTFASYAYETFHLIMPLYLCRKWKGTPYGAEGQQLAWVRYHDLVNYPFPPPDIMLTNRLADALMREGVW
jgi:8-oxo-dGTP diphosphatase